MPRPGSRVTPRPGAAPCDIGVTGPTRPASWWEAQLAEPVQGGGTMAAGTAQKATLNMLSTLIGVRLGHVHDNFMVNVTADNAKLVMRATGIVGEYEGQLQVVPEWGRQVKALRAAAPSAPARQIASITAADEGQRVMIEGTVARIEKGETYVRLFVNDGSGEMLVFIWTNVYERIPDRERLDTPGTPVQVVGTVAIYKGTLEVIPTLPYDVIVR